MAKMTTEEFLASVRPHGKTRRAPKTNRVPKTRAGGEWTEAALWGFLRSGLRQMSRRWPPIARQAINASRRHYSGPNKRQKWEYQCCDCREWFQRTWVHVDHVLPCGTLRSWDDLRVFAERLFCEPDGLRVLCTTCHERRHGAEQIKAVIS